MNNPQIIIKPSLDRQGYVLTCRFPTRPYPSLAEFNREKVIQAEKWLRAMHQQGWKYADQGITVTGGPSPPIIPTTIRVPKTLSARDIAPMVANGARFLPDGDMGAPEALTLETSEWWEFVMEALFHRPTIMMEYPDLHEEVR